MLLGTDPRTGDSLLPPGEPIDGWRLQLRPGDGPGRPRVVRDEDGGPLLLPPDADEEDCEEHRRKGWALVALAVRGNRTVLQRPIPSPAAEAREEDEEEGEEPGAFETAAADLLRAHAEATRAQSEAHTRAMANLGEIVLAALAAGADLAGRAPPEKEGGSVEERAMTLAETMLRIKGAETAAKLAQQSTTPPPSNGAPAPQKGK